MEVIIAKIMILFVLAIIVAIVFMLYKVCKYNEIIEENRRKTKENWKDIDAKLKRMDEQADRFFKLINEMYDQDD